MIVKTCLLVFFLVFFPVFSPFFSWKFYLIFSRFIIHFSLFGLCAVDNWWHGRGWWLAAMPTTCGGFQGPSWGHFVGDRFAKFWMVVVLVSDNFSGIRMPLTCLVTFLKFHQFPGWVDRPSPQLRIQWNPFDGWLSIPVNRHAWFLAVTDAMVVVVYIDL